MQERQCVYSGRGADRQHEFRCRVRRTGVGNWGGVASERTVPRERTRMGELGGGGAGGVGALGWGENSGQIVIGHHGTSCNPLLGHSLNARHYMSALEAKLLKIIDWAGWNWTHNKWLRQFDCNIVNLCHSWILKKQRCQYQLFCCIYFENVNIQVIICI